MTFAFGFETKECVELTYTFFLSNLDKNIRRMKLVTHFKNQLN